MSVRVHNHWRNWNLEGRLRTLQNTLKMPRRSRLPFGFLSLLRPLYLSDIPLAQAQRATAELAHTRSSHSPLPLLDLGLLLSLSSFLQNDAIFQSLAATKILTLCSFRNDALPLSDGHFLLRVDGGFGAQVLETEVERFVAAFPADFQGGAVFKEVGLFEKALKGQVLFKVGGVGFVVVFVSWRLSFGTRGSNCRVFCSRRFRCLEQICYRRIVI